MRFLLIVVILLAGCCSCPHASDVARNAIAVNAGHMADDALPQEAREIATDNHDLWWAVINHLDGDPLTEDVLARKKAREESTVAAVGSAQ